MRPRLLPIVVDVNLLRSAIGLEFDLPQVERPFQAGAYSYRG